MLRMGKRLRLVILICNWDAFNNVIVATTPGKLEYVDIVDNITAREEMDEKTGFKEKVVIQSKDKKMIPSFTLFPIASQPQSRSITFL